MVARAERYRANGIMMHGKEKKRRKIFEYKFNA
jgi:hypothetical protein